MEAVFLLSISIFVIAVYWVVCLLRHTQKDQQERISKLIKDIDWIQLKLERNFNSIDNQLYQIDGMVSDMEDELGDTSLRYRLNTLPDFIHVEDRCYALNIHIHNDGVNLDYMDEADELFSLGQSSGVNTPTISDCLYEVIKNALVIIEKEQWSEAK